MFLRNARTPPTRQDSVIFPDEANISLFRRRKFNSHTTHVIRFNFLMCHSKLAKRGAFSHSENKCQSSWLPGKGEGNAGRNVQALRQFPNIFK